VSVQSRGWESCLEYINLESTGAVVTGSKSKGRYASVRLRVRSPVCEIGTVLNFVRGDLLGSQILGTAAINNAFKLATTVPTDGCSI
jgi:hypothetical protein